MYIIITAKDSAASIVPIMFLVLSQTFEQHQRAMLKEQFNEVACAETAAKFKHLFEQSLEAFKAEENLTINLT